MQLGSLIRRAALHFKDSPCLTEGNRTLSFKEFDEATDRLGNALLEYGLNPGDRVSVILPNSIDCLIAYYALAKSGLVRVQLNTRETLENHRYKISDSGSRGVIHDDVEGVDAEIMISASDLRKLIRSAKDTPCAVDRELDEPLRLSYTGGTTGKPKGVTLTTRGELVEMSAFLMDLIPGISEQNTFLHAAPIAHASGAFFLPAMVRGAHSVIMKKFDVGEFIRMAQEIRADYTFLVPTMLAMILEDPSINESKMEFKRIAYGASSISPSLMKRSEACFGRVFVQCYGQAESPMVITCLQPEDHDRVGSCGRPFTVADVAIFDENDKPLPAGERGEIVVRGPQTMAYYWGKPDKTKEAFRNGWLHTGDIGEMDEDGFFYIVDRKNDMLISGGYNVYPREVEDVLLEFPGVIEAAVVGIPDEHWGDKVIAVLSGRGIDADKVMKHARQKLAVFKCPKDIFIWSEELPKSAANKILRRDIREKVMDSASGK